MLGWGTADFLAAKSSRRIGYALTLFWMQIIGLTVAFIYFLITVRSLDTIVGFLGILFAVGFFELIGYLSLYKGLKEGAICVVSPIAASWAVVTVILSIIFFKEALQTNHITGITIIILGTILVSTNIRELLAARRMNFFRGAKEGLIAMTGFGLGNLLIVPPVKVLGWFLPALFMRLFGTVLLALFMLFKKKPFKTNSQLTIMALLVPIGIIDMASFFSYNIGVLGSYTSIVAPIAAAFPLITIVLARIFLKEKIVLSQTLGIAMIIFGLILIAL